MRTLLLLRRLALPLVALFCLLLGACQEQPTGTGPAGNESVSGTLSDEIGNLVPGAIVEAVGAADARIALDTTNDYGAFTLAGLPANLTGVQLRVVHTEFKPFTTSIQSIVALAGGKEGVLLSLLHDDSCCAKLVVTVTGANGVPLGNTEVRLRRGDHLISTGHTDSTGHITFTNVCNGEFNLRLSRDGYHVMERGGVHVTNCDTTRLEFAMNANENEHHDDTCCNGKLRIMPRDSATHAVLSGASVRITKLGGTARTITSNGDGTIFRELCSGTYNVRIAKEGYRVIEFQITVNCNDSVYTDRYLAHLEEHHGDDSCCNGRVDIIPRDSATNAILNGATVKLYKGATLLSTKTTAEGHTVFEGLCIGTYSISIFKDGYKHIEYSFTLTCNQHVEITRTLAAEHAADTCCHGAITIIARDSASNAVLANTGVRLSKGGVNIGTGTTNANGVVGFDGLCEGTYVVNMTRDGYHAREFTVVITCNQHREVTGKMLHNEGDTTCCNAVMRFRVKDSTVAEGGWLTGVTVTIKRGNDVIATGTTNGEGNYAHDGICGNATYTVTFTKEHFHLKTVTFTLTTCRTIEETIRIVPE
jgi:hypothetical protein